MTIKWTVRVAMAKMGIFTMAEPGRRMAESRPSAAPGRSIPPDVAASASQASVADARPLRIE